MENQDQNVSADFSLQQLGSQSQNSSVIFNTPQPIPQNSFHNRIPSGIQTNGIPVTNNVGMPMQNPLPPGQQNMGQPNYANYPYPMQNVGMMPNPMGNNMMQLNYDWLQNAMRLYSPQMFPPINPGFNYGMNPVDFFTLANNMMIQNSYRNAMGQPMNPMNQPMTQPVGNVNPSISPFLPQTTPQKVADSPKMNDNNLKIEDLMSNNVNSLNQFYNYLNSQIKDGVTSSTNFGSSVNQSSTPVTIRKSNEYTNESSINFPQQGDSAQQRDGYKHQDFRTKNNPSTTEVPSNFKTVEKLKDSPHFESPSLEPEYGQASSRGKVDKAEESNYYSNVSARTNRTFGKNANDDIEEVHVIVKEREAPHLEEAPKSKRRSFDWEDVPIKSKFIVKKHEEEGGNNETIESESYNSRSKNSFDAVAAKEYRNPHDEIQIVGRKHKRFEDLLEEQLQAIPDAIDPLAVKEKNPNKQFLKKGTRNFLASAALKDPKLSSRSYKENISNTEGANANNDSGVMVFNVAEKPSLRSNVNFGNQQEKNKEVAEQSTPNSKEIKHKEPKKYLTRGAGIGGGIGGSEKERRSTTIEKSLERNEERLKTSQSRGRLDTKKPRDTKGREKGKAGTERARSEASMNDDTINEGQSFDKEYTMEKYSRRSPKERQRKLSKPKQTSKYNFEDGNSMNEDHESHIEDDENQEDVAVSNLADKYFDKENQITEKTIEEVREEENEGDSKIQKVVSEKMETLNSEIAKFKLENERVKKIRQKHEEMLKNLNRDIAEWNKQKEKEVKDFEAWKQEEIRKMRNEKKLIDKNQKATVTNVPNKKDKEEIESLKKQVAKLTEDMQAKEKRSKLTIDKLKKQIEELELRNKELLQELKRSDQMKPKGGVPKITDSNNEQNKLPLNIIKRNDTGKSYEAQITTEEEENEPNDEEHDEEYDENKNVIEERNEDEEEEEAERSEESSEDERETEKDNLKNRNSLNKSESVVSQSNVSKIVNERVNQQNGRNIGNNTQQQQQQDRGTQKNEKEIVAKPSQNRNLSVQDYNFDANQYYKKYAKSKAEPGQIVSQTTSGDGKTQKIYADGKKEVLFHNGVKREIFSDGYTIVHFANKDIKQTLPDSTVIYFFADAQTTQTTLPNGLHIYKFANNQLEFHNADGSKNIYFADQTTKTIFSNGEEETVFSDGTIQRVNAQKIKTIDYISGQKDVIYPDGLKIRTYPDGRIKKYHPNGIVEEM